MLRERVIRWLIRLPKRPQIFVEPFLGGGSISLAVAELGLVDAIIASELDDNVAAVWKVALGGSSEELCRRILTFRLTRDSVVTELDSPPSSELDKAFHCILRNRVQRGGVMAPGAGLLKRGERDKGISSRWYPDTLAKRIRQINKLSDRILFLEEDGIATLEALKANAGCCAFIDPPYFADGKGAGRRLYTHYDISPEVVFETAAKLDGPAVLTYHRSQNIRRLAKASSMKCSEIAVRTSHAKVRRELFITKAPSVTAS